MLKNFHEMSGLATYHPIPGLEHAYWVVPGGLLAGAYPGAPEAEASRRQLQALLATGVRWCLNLMQPHEVDRQGRPFRPYEAELSGLGTAVGARVGFARMPIPDLGVPQPAEMTRILDAVDRTAASGRTVYVHCLGGIGRTGTVVGCYLARHGLAWGDAALDRVARLREATSTAARRSPETAAQADFVRAWAVGA
jgi:hypothetical protein